MDQNVQIQASVEHGMRALGVKYKTAITRALKIEHDRDKLSKFLVEMRCTDDNMELPRDYYLTLPVYFAHQGNFRLSWCCYCLMSDVGLRGEKREYPPGKTFRALERAEYIYECWGLAPDPSPDPKKAKLRSRRRPPSFKPDDVEYNKEQYGIGVRSGVAIDEEPFDFSPDARFRKVKDDECYYTSWEGSDTTCEVLEHAFVHEQYSDLRELIFRMKIVLSLGEPPSYLWEHSKIRHLAPWLYFYEAWLDARQSEDPEQRKLLAWTAVYWLVEALPRTAGGLHGCHADGFQAYCGLVAEFDLFEERQSEFLSYFKLFAMQTSISVAKKMIADPTPVKRDDEMDICTFEECKDIYDEMELKVKTRLNNRRARDRERRRR